MSWQEAKAAAARWAEEAGFPADLSGKIALLPDFESEKECRFFLPERSDLFHKMVLKGMGRIVRVADGRVVLQYLTPKRYKKLLGEREDTLEARLEYFKRNTRLLEE